MESGESSAGWRGTHLQMKMLGAADEGKFVCAHWPILPDQSADGLGAGIVAFFDGQQEVMKAVEVAQTLQLQHFAQCFFERLP
jgi:hypothetical protein